MLVVPTVDTTGLALLTLQRIGGYAALKIHRPVDHQWDARGRCNRNQFYPQVAHFQAYFDGIHNPVAKVHRVANGIEFFIQIGKRR